MTTFQFGPPIISEFERKRRAEDSRMWAEGYTASELDDAQARFGFVFPPDLVQLFRDRRLVRAYDWRTDIEAIESLLKWPLEGLSSIMSFGGRSGELARRRSKVAHPLWLQWSKAHRS